MPSNTKTKETVTSKVVDFSNVKEGGGSFNKRRVRSGDYLAKVVKVQDAEAKKSGAFQYLYTIQLVRHSQNKYPYYCQLEEKSLWKLRNLFIAGGVNVPKARVKLDPRKVVGKLIGVTMDDTEYEGKPQSEVVAVFPASELADAEAAGDDDTDDGMDDSDDDGDDSMDDLADDAGDDEDSDDDAEEESDDEDEGETEDEFASMDRTALKAYLKAQDASFQAKKSQSDDDLRELARAAAGGDEDEDEDDEPEPEPEPPKAKKKKAKAKPKADDDEEFEELDLDEL